MGTDGERHLDDDYVKSMLQKMKPYNDSCKEAVRELGDRIGYGNMMHLAEQVWREKLIPQGLEGGEFAHGPCVAFMVPCPHPVKDHNGHCDICCGAGRITKGVAALLKTSTTN